MYEVLTTKKFTIFSVFYTMYSKKYLNFQVSMIICVSVTFETNLFLPTIFVSYIFPFFYDFCRFSHVSFKLRKILKNDLPNSLTTLNFVSETTYLVYRIQPLLLPEIVYTNLKKTHIIGKWILLSLLNI